MLKRYKFKYLIPKFLVIIGFLIISGLSLSGCTNLSDLILQGTGANGDFTNLTRNDLIISAWNIVRWGVVGIGVPITIIIVYAGIQYMLALGNEEKLEKAKQTLYWAIAGLVVVVLAFSVITYLLQQIKVLT